MELLGILNATNNNHTSTLSPHSASHDHGIVVPQQHKWRPNTTTTPMSRSSSFQRTQRNQKRTIVSTCITRHTTTNNPYQLLRVRRDATEHELVDAYRRLALLHHPLLQLQKRTSTTKRKSTARTDCDDDDDITFATIAAAFETLHDKNTRLALDTLLQQQQQPSNFDDDNDNTTLLHKARRGKPFTDPFVIFHQVFGSSFLCNDPKQQNENSTPCQDDTHGDSNRNDDETQSLRDIRTETDSKRLLQQSPSNDMRDDEPWTFSSCCGGDYSSGCWELHCY